jgi:hypothetical protein
MSGIDERSEVTAILTDDSCRSFAALDDNALDLVLSNRSEDFAQTLLANQLDGVPRRRRANDGVDLQVEVPDLSMIADRRTGPSFSQ